MKRIILTLLYLTAHKAVAQAPDVGERYSYVAIGFWNVENLYDTLNDPRKNDEDFLPAGPNAWTGERYRKKIIRLAEVISQMATDATPAGLSLLGVCEVENKEVLEDLVNSPALRKRNYKYVLIEGPDARGVDPAFIYNPGHFKLKKAVSYAVTLVTDSSHRTRDILAVSGSLDGDAVAVLVNHWPSRRGGELLSRANRNVAARIARRIADSIVRSDPQTRIVIMGDLNDDPVNESVKLHIGTCKAIKDIAPGKYYNPMEVPYEKGIGTLAWQDSWNLFDQIMLNAKWLDQATSGWKYHTVRIFNKPFLKSDHGNFKGYPFRTYSGGVYSGGYSDHFPAYIIVRKEQN